MAVKQKILIVDDEKMNRELLTDLLKDDYQIMVASSGKQVLKVTSNPEKCPDLILLDIQMPEMNGYEVCQKLKETNITKAIPVIFVTSMSDVSDESRGFDIGAVDYITKPFSPPILLARVKNHLELKRSLQSEKRLNELKNKFLGMAAHDLRNPLGAIRGLSELILTLPLSDEEKGEFINDIYKTSDQMLDLLNELLDVSVIESGKFDLHFEPTKLSDLANERIKVANHSATIKDIKLTTDFQEDEITSIDPKRISQVIDNLLSNAIKFSHSGTVITIRITQSNDFVLLSVSDQGQGIPEKEIGKIFGEFQKLSAIPTAGESSTGLGMFIVKKIIDAHKGTIDVESVLGEGTTFTVSLPLKAEL